MGFWEKVLPGYKGYREREDARNTDKKLREFLAERLRQARNHYDEHKGSIANRGNLDLLNPAEKVTQKLGRVKDRLRYANYGFTGRWFGKDKIDRERLDRVHDFDKQLVEIIEQFGRDVEALGLLDDDAQIRAALEGLVRQLGQLDQALDRREEILRAAGGGPEQ